MKFKNRKRQLVPVVNVIEIFSSSEDETDDDEEDESNEIAPIDPVIEISDDESDFDRPINADLAEINLPDDDRPLDQLVRPVEPCPVLNVSTDDSDDDRKSDNLDLDNVRWSSPSDSDSDSSDYGDEFINHMIPGKFNLVVLRSDKIFIF